MAETDVFPLDPDYEIEVSEADGVLRLGAEDRSQVKQQRWPPQRTFTLRFGERSTDEMEQLRDWKRRFAGSFFRFDHKVWVNNAGTYLARSFPVEWLDDTLTERLVTTELNEVQVRLLEAVGQPLQAGGYPDPAAGHPSFFIEENDPQGRAVALAGSWTNTSDVNDHAANAKWNANTNTTDAFQFVYGGYGFRLWARKRNDLGILEVFLDGVSLGNVDLYNATLVPSAVVLSKLDVKLGIHRVKIKATNTKNASSSDKIILADAVEVMP